MRKITAVIPVRKGSARVKNKNLKPKFRALDEIESIDIDTEFDFLVAEYIYQRIRKEGESNYA